MTSQPNPTLARRELAALLRQAREQRGYSLDVLTSRLGVSAPQASRLDAGVRGYRPDDVRNLASHYDLGNAQTTRLLELAEEARRRAWWQQIDLHEAYRTLIGYEQGASTIAEYGGAIIPGLLQVPSYSAAVARHGQLDTPVEVVERAVDVRMRRQGVLDADQAPRLRVVIDEVALARGPRDAEVKRSQLKHLLEASARPTITIQVIGFEYGLHPGDRSHFIIVSTGTIVPDLVYSEGLIEPQVLETAADLHRYRDLWEELRAIALDPAASRDRIEQYIR